MITSQQKQTDADLELNVVQGHCYIGTNKNKHCIPKRSKTLFISVVFCLFFQCHPPLQIVEPTFSMIPRCDLFSAKFKDQTSPKQLAAFSLHVEIRQAGEKVDEKQFTLYTELKLHFRDTTI